MTKNPILNALAAFAYIAVVASFMSYVEKVGTAQPDKTILGPIAFISLISLSVASMGYIFFSNPIQLFLDGKKKEAVNLFVKTLITFGVITIALLFIVFSGILQ